MRGAVFGIIAAVLLIVAASCLFSGGGDSDDDLISPDPSEPEPVPGYPDGVHVDVQTCTVSFDSSVDWKVYDLLSSYYVKDGYNWSLYEGYGGTGQSIELGPGMYRITAADSEFEAVFPGTLHRTSEWIYDMGGAKHQISVSYDIDIERLAQQRDGSRDFNTPHTYLFSELPSLVSITDEIRSLESSMRSEFVRIGGDPDDEQGYADFLASFVQCAITYPYRMSGHGEDYSIYGQDEYWSMPLETLNLQYGDCEDTSILLCAIYAAAGYDPAVGGSSGHVYCGVALSSFIETSEERLKELDPYRPFKLFAYTPVEGSCSEEYADIVYYAVETIYDQLPVGYLGSGTRPPGSSTFWGTAGFYPYQGAESGIQAPS